MILVAEQLCVDLLLCNRCNYRFPWGWFTSFFTGKDPAFCPVCRAEKKEEDFFTRITKTTIPKTKITPPPLFIEILACDTCGQNFPWTKDDQNLKYCPHCGIKFEQ